jgi:DNA-binding LacI/PurR family transcriptional regulator
MDIPVITVENKDGAEMLVSHLIEKHDRRRIVFLRGPEGHEDSVWRQRGYREALASHDIPFDEALISSGDFDQETAFHAMQKIIQNGIKFDAVFSGDDASIIYRALRKPAHHS